jgi:hypothetical protein
LHGNCVCHIRVRLRTTRIDNIIFETNNCKTKQDGGTEGSFKFGSWTYHGDLIDLKLMNEEVDLSNYQEDAAYKLVNTTAQRNDVIKADELEGGSV